MATVIMPDIRQLDRQHRNNTGKNHFKGYITPSSSSEAEKEALWRSALELVARIDEDLTRGVRHYRTKAGLLLTTLDEVVRALVEGNLAEPEGVA